MKENEDAVNVLPDWVTIVEDLRQRHVEVWLRDFRAPDEDMHPIVVNGQFARVAEAAGMVVFADGKGVGDLTVHQTAQVVVEVNKRIREALNIDPS